MSDPREALAEQVFKVLRGPCGVVETFDESSRLAEDLHLDSVGLLALAVSLENHYKVRLSDDPTDPPATVGDVVDLLEQALAPSQEERKG